MGRNGRGEVEKSRPLEPQTRLNVYTSSNVCSNTRLPPFQPIKVSHSREEFEEGVGWSSHLSIDAERKKDRETSLRETERERAIAD